MMKKYEAVANQIAQSIRASAYCSGDRLPSIRSLAVTYSASITTVVASLRLLENRGIVEARDRAGFFVGNNFNGQWDLERPGKLSGHRLQESDSIKETLNLNLHSMIPLGSAIPAAGYLPIRQIQRSLLKSSRRVADSLSYSFPGNSKYLAAVARRMTNTGIISQEADIISTGGAQEAVVLALRAVVREGETVAVISPSYPGMLQALKALRVQIVEIPFNDDGKINFRKLASAITHLGVKALCLSANVNNPTGFTLSVAEKIKLAELSSKTMTPIIEDDIYGDLYFGDQRPQPLKAFDCGNWVIYCSSFSKTISPGLRAGWIIPGRFYAEVLNQKYLLNLATPTVTQMAVADFLESSSFDLYLRGIRKTYRQNTSKLREWVFDHFPKGTKCTNPSGGYLLWITLPSELDTTRVYQTAMEKGAYFAPGKLFSATKGHANCLRISGAHPVGASSERALIDLAGELRRAEAQRSKLDLSFA